MDSPLAIMRRIFMLSTQEERDALADAAVARWEAAQQLREARLARMAAVEEDDDGVDSTG